MLKRHHKATFGFLIIFFCCAIIGQAQTPYRIKKLLFQDNFDQKLDTTHWFCELKQPSNNRAFVENGQLVIDVAKGATVWFAQKLKNNWLIEFDRAVVVEGGKNDRLSDFNIFWQATDPLSKSGKKLFGRSPEFENYDSLSLYYIGFGGNTNKTTRFRKYQGTGEKTILQEHSDAEHLLKANKTYHCRLVMLRDTVFFYVDNVLFFTFKDVKPLKSGYFAFRTTQSRHKIDNFRVYRIK
jgi:rhamnogalacturonan endolyase